MAWPAISRQGRWQGGPTPLVQEIDEPHGLPLHAHAAVDGEPRPVMNLARPSKEHHNVGDLRDLTEAAKRCQAGHRPAASAALGTGRCPHSR